MLKRIVVVVVALVYKKESIDVRVNVDSEVYWRIFAIEQVHVFRRMEWGSCGWQDPLLPLQTTTLFKFSDQNLDKAG